MNFIKYIKDIIFFEKDEDFFNKEATIKEYFKKCPLDKRKKVKSYDELYEEALKVVGKQNFDENTKNMEDFFYEMSKTDSIVAILTGVLAYKIACSVDENGKNLEQGIDKLLKGYDVNNPFDTKVGYNHRDFGHDTFTFGLKNIPNDYPICVDRMDHNPICLPIGEVLGKDGNISMLDLIWYFYKDEKKSLLSNIFNCAGHIIVHFAKDLLTSAGVPLPFSSLLNTYINDGDDYLLTNDFNRKVDRYKGNLKASDFASLGFVEGMCKLYAHTKQLGEKEKSFNSDLKIIAMGTCVMLQMSSMILGEQKVTNQKKGMIPGAKLNVVMTSVLFKNMVQEMTIVVKARHEVNAEYDKQIENIERRKIDG